MKLSLFNKDKIGAAIIVKNAASTIADTIRSVKKICSHIVVVDTGSDDETTRICAQEGVDVFFLKWKNDFSYARNYAISCLNTEWILSIDADEEFVPQSIGNSMDLLDNPNIGGINIILENSLSTSDPNAKSYHRYTRIFRNDKRIIFKGRVHEQIRESIEHAGYEIAESRIVIKHKGYQYLEPAKIERNRSLLQLELEDNPDDHWLKYHLGNTEFAQQNIEKAFELFSEVKDSMELSLDQNEMIRIKLAQILLRQDKFNEIEPYLSFKSEDNDREGLRLFIFASACLGAHQFAAAHELFSKKELLKSVLVDSDQVKEAINVLEQIPGL